MVLMSLYVNMNELYFVNIAMATEFYAERGTVAKKDKSRACLSSQCDVIRRDDVAQVPIYLFIFCCVLAELQLHFSPTTKSIGRNQIFLSLFLSCWGIKENVAR